MPLKWKWPKYSKIFNNDQNNPKSKNDQNMHETQKITKIPPKPKNYQNTLKNLKMTKILPKPKTYQNPFEA